MNPAGAADLMVAARSALLDALEALSDQRDALVLIGAQAIYLHTGATSFALAESTKDSDIAVDPGVLADEPLLEAAMSTAGFHRDLTYPQPGRWLSQAGIPVDLMVPEALAGTGGRRGARIPPHSSHATRRTTGLEAAVVDNAPMTVRALADNDARSATIKVASPAALLIAKLHKLGERQRDDPSRLADKDAHDVYRLLVATNTAAIAERLRNLRSDDFAGEVALQAIQYLRDMFGVPNAIGAVMAGRAEELVGQPEVTSTAASALSTDLLSALGD